ncbi:MAG: hypothetical protein ABR514_04040 [Chthoniobacterales bacterium]
MADAESIREAVRAHAPFSTWVGVVALFFLFGVIVLAVVGPAPRGDTFEKIRAKKRLDNLKAAREADAKELEGYGWVDKNKGVIRIPIERAMQLTVADLARQRPAPADPIAAAGPQAAAPAPAGAAPPSPTVSPAPSPSVTPKPTSITGPNSEAAGRPAAAVQPAGAPPGSQPGAAATPAASPQSSAAQPAVSPSSSATPSPPGSPLPVRGTTPPGDR